MGVEIPDSLPSDNPRATILINPKWLPVLLGLCVDNLLLRSYWNGTEGEIDSVIDDTDDLIFILSTAMQELAVFAWQASAWAMQTALIRFQAFEGANLITGYTPDSPYQAIPLKLIGSGGVTTMDTSGLNNRAIGDNSGNQWVAQSFIPANAGILKEVIVRFASSTGSPVGSVVWELRPDSGGNPDSLILYSDSFTPVINSLNTLTVDSRLYMGESNTYWLIFRCNQTQGSGIRYNINSNNTAPYSGGVLKRSVDGGSSWISDTGDLRGTIETLAIVSNDSIALNFISPSEINLNTVRLFLRKYGNPTGDLTLSLYNDLDGLPDTALEISDPIDSATLTNLFSLQIFDFSTPYMMAANTQYWLVLETSDSGSSDDWIEIQSKDID